MSLATFFRRPRSQRPRPVRTRLQVEPLESRDLLSNLTLGPLVQVSSTSAFAGATSDNVAGQPGTNYLGSEVEPWVAVDPTNPSHIVGVYQQDRWSNAGARGLVAQVSFDGGASWQPSVIPGLSLVSGGTSMRASDPWLSFAPNGDLYASSLSFDIDLTTGALTRNAVLVNKSTDGGLSWSNPTTLIEDSDLRFFNDKESITADPTNANFAYAVWVRLDQPKGNLHKGTAMISRTTDGGQTWEAPQVLYAPDGNDVAQYNQIVVQPDGTLVDFFVTQFQPNGVVTPYVALVRSTDHGHTWLPNGTKVITVAPMQLMNVSDPDTSQPVRTGTGVPDVAVDPKSGNLYTVWQDDRFSGGLYNSIAFSMSTDGGFTWSSPIKINKTPTNIATGNQQAFTPSIEVAADGTVGVTYYDFRNNTAAPRLLTDYWFIHAHPSSDLTNPASWDDEQPLTKKSFDLEKAPVARGRGYFVGDYEGLAAAGNSFVALFAQTQATDPASIFFRAINAAAAATTNTAGTSLTAATLAATASSLPALSINDVKQFEGTPTAEDFTTDFVFTVSLSAPSDQSVTFNYATTDGTATSLGNSADYGAASGTLTFLPGQTSLTITITVFRDRAHEGNEKFYLNLSNAINATIADDTGVGTILNDDWKIGGFGT